MFPKKKLLFNVYEYPFYFMRFCNIQRLHWRLDLIKKFVQSKAEHGMALVGSYFGVTHISATSII